MAHYFQISEPDFWQAITPEPLRWSIDAARIMDYEAGTVVMSDNPLDPDAPAATLLGLPPGGLLPRHAHPCHRVEVMVRGSIELDDGRVLKPGDVMISAPGEFYGPHLAGPEGSLSVEIFSKLTGTQPIYDAREETPEHAEKMRQVDEVIKNALSEAQQHLPSP